MKRRALHSCLTMAIVLVACAISMIVWFLANT